MGDLLARKRGEVGSIGATLRDSNYLTVHAALCRHDNPLASATRCLRAAAAKGLPPKAYGGFCLTEPKAGSSGTVDLDPVVRDRLARHVRAHPPVGVEMLDQTGVVPVHRTVPLLFTTARGNPFTDRTWSAEWIKWRTRAGWPDDARRSGFHALRHFFATTLITNHVDPKDVQRALRHATLQKTLEIYVHYWPRRERRKGIAGAVLEAAADRLNKS